MNTIVTEQTEMGAMPIDIYAKLASDRILFINGHIDDQMATDTTATLLLKDFEEESQKISLFINSDGGDIRSVFMIYDMMQLVRSPIETYCVGMAQDEAVLLLAAGTPGLRFATGNAIISPSMLAHIGGFYSTVGDAKTEMKRFQADNKDFMELLAKHSKNSLTKVMTEFEHKVFYTPKKAQTFGLIDHVIMGKRS